MTSLLLETNSGASNMLSRRLCAGCGAEVPPSAHHGRPRKWCSERCRKQTLYSHPCEDCGAPTTGDGQHHRWCRKCSNKYASDRARAARLPVRAEIEARWADGQTEREICGALGLKYDDNHKGHISMWRGRGYDLPYRRSAAAREHMAVGSDERLEKARRVARGNRERSA